MPPADHRANNAVEMIRLLHHAHTRTRPDLATYPGGACLVGKRELYIPPGPPTLIAPFVVVKDFLTQAASRVANTSAEPTWEMIQDMSKLDGLGSLQVTEKAQTGVSGPAKSHQVLAPRLHVMIAGAPVLSALLSEVPAVFERKVCSIRCLR